MVEFGNHQPDEHIPIEPAHEGGEDYAPHIPEPAAEGEVEAYVDSGIIPDQTSEDAEPITDSPERDYDELLSGSNPKVIMAGLPGEFALADFDQPLARAKFTINEELTEAGSVMKVDPASQIAATVIERGAIEGLRIHSEEAYPDPAAGVEAGIQAGEPEVRLLFGEPATVTPSEARNKLTDEQIAAEAEGASGQLRRGILELRSQSRLVRENPTGEYQPVGFTPEASALLERGLESLAAKGEAYAAEYADVMSFGGVIPQHVMAAISDGDAARSVLDTLSKARAHANLKAGKSLLATLGEVVQQLHGDQVDDETSEEPQQPHDK